MGFAKSADQVKDLLKKKVLLSDVFNDIQNNTEIVLSENAPEPLNAAKHGSEVMPNHTCML